MSEKIDEATSLNLYQKLAKIRKTVEVIRKNKSGYGYKYVTDAEILARVTGMMDKLEVSLIPGIVPGTLEVNPYTYEKTKFDKDTKTAYQETVNEILVKADAVYTWVNNTNPEEQIVVPWALVGQQADASQSFGSGLTYTYRYFLLKYFGASTVDDDPDNWRSKQREAAEAEERAIAEQIIKEFDEEIRKYLGDNQKKGSEVKALVTKYVKNGDYFAITDPALATKLYNDFRATFMKENT